MLFDVEPFGDVTRAEVFAFDQVGVLFRAWSLARRVDQAGDVLGADGRNAHCAMPAQRAMSAFAAAVDAKKSGDGLPVLAS